MLSSFVFLELVGDEVELLMVELGLWRETRGEEAYECEFLRESYGNAYRGTIGMALNLSGKSRELSGQMPEDFYSRN